MLKTAEFDFSLPERLIARRPAARRDESRLLVMPRRGPLNLRHETFSALAGLLGSGDLLVLNQSRVLPARLIARKAGTGARIEVFLLRERAPQEWETLVRPGRKVRPGDRLIIAPRELEAVIEGYAGRGERIVRFETPLPWDEALRRHGHTPLPPYILKARKHDAGREILEEPEDRERYQTVYATAGASVAAPTAGLHFTPDLLRRLEEAGVEIARVELDVGAGTFLPVEEENPALHPIHAEPIRVPAAAAAAVRRARSEGRRVVAVGTTVVRALETLAAQADGVREFAGETSMFILPGHEFRAIDALITNFHLPRSTLLMLVAAFAGRDRALAAYAEAVRREYRFYSYGDAMLIV